MWKFTDILVVLDTRKEQQMSVNRALQVAQTTGAQLHVLAPNPNATTESWEKLKAITAPLKQAGLTVNLHETWHRSINETIIHVRQMEGCQLVIKDAKPEGMLAQTFGTPKDWSLLRQCEVPVLLVKHDHSWEQAAMIAAVNADQDDYQHIQLNQAILDYAGCFARQFSSELHLASAYPTVRLPFQDKGNGITADQSYKATCLHYARDYPILEHHIHVEPGSAEALIPHLVKTQKARLLIMGTHARTGISALAIGNTAEQLISEVDTDMLILQPRDHMPPLEEELGR
ncbi:universal stress protein [Endozoicomonas sp. Mp262]|uniref:universal stress protein n=1 Tax=Endozoicomonas sp. Mp262 TaxID=2919499 RepID=UPI0021D8D704